MRILERNGCEVIGAPPGADGGGDPRATAGRGAAVAGAGRPGASRLRRRDGAGAHRQDADHGHLPGAPSGCAGAGREHLQAEVWAPGREPPGEGASYGHRSHHGAEPRLRRRRGRAAAGARDYARQPERRDGGGGCGTARRPSSPSNTTRRRPPGPARQTSTCSTPSCAWCGTGAPSAREAGGRPHPNPPPRGEGVNEKEGRTWMTEKPQKVLVIGSGADRDRAGGRVRLRRSAGVQGAAGGGRHHRPRPTPTRPRS